MLMLMRERRIAIIKFVNVEPLFFSKSKLS